MNKQLSVYNIIIAIFLTAFLMFSFSRQAKTPPMAAASPQDARAIPQIVKGVDLKQQYQFAGERLPLESVDVRERLDRELTVNTYWHSSTLLNLKKTSKYFPTIERIFAEEGVPDDLKYLAVAESNLENATSPAGAKGIWQFMKSTAVAYDLEVNSEVDERYHLEKATRAAAAYLKSYKERFGSWTLAAAAYNMGGTALSRELDRQRSDNYYDLNISEETMRYVFRIVAIKEVIKHPADFGFYLDSKDRYAPFGPYKYVEVNSPIENWGDFAKNHNISYRELKLHNPWLRSYKLGSTKGKTYQIAIPE